VALFDDFVSDARQIANGVANVVKARGSGDFTALRDGHEWLRVQQKEMGMHHRDTESQRK
jgi:hypothetical protein